MYTGGQLNRGRYRDLRFPLIEDFCDNRIVELPVHPTVGREEIHQAAESINKVIAGIGGSGRS